MIYKRYLPGIIIAFLILTGFTCCSTSPTAGNAPKASYVALGDSLSLGLFAVPQNGFVSLYHDWLQQNEYPQGVNLTNLGKYGWTSTDLLGGLKADQTLREAVAGADVITLEIGGSDLVYGNFDQDRFGLILTTFKSNFPEIIGEIKCLNKSARLVVLDLYNPFPQDDKRFELANQAIEQFNQIIHKSASDIVAPVYQSFQGHEREYISWLDRIHPNNLGHKIINDCLIDETLNLATRRNPFL